MKGSNLCDEELAGGQKKKLRLELEAIVVEDPESCETVVTSVVSALIDAVEALVLRENVKEEGELTRFVSETIVEVICLSDED